MAGPGAVLSMSGSRVEELRRRLERDPGSRIFAQLAEEHRKAGDHGEAIAIPGASHFDPVIPTTAAWQVVVGAIAREVARLR